MMNSALPLEQCSCDGNPLADDMWTTCAQCRAIAEPPRNPLDEDAWRIWLALRSAVMLLAMWEPRVGNAPHVATLRAHVSNLRSLLALRDIVREGELDGGPT